MGKSPSQKREDEVLLRMLKTPPKPHADMKAKDKANSKASKAGGQSEVVPAHNDAWMHCRQDKKVYRSFGLYDDRRYRMS